MPFRLAPDQMRRLERAAHSLRKTKQSFVQEIVLERIAEVEENKRISKRPPITDGTQKRQEGDAEHGGLGLTALIKERQQQKQEAAETPLTPPTAPVVVQVGNTTAPTTNGKAPLGELDRLALYIVKGDDFMRDTRKRTAVEVLRATADTDEELKVLVARLEELVAIKTKTQSENTGFNKFAKLAFEKIESLLKGA